MAYIRDSLENSLESDRGSDPGKPTLYGVIFPDCRCKACHRRTFATDGWCCVANGGGNPIIIPRKLAIQDDIADLTKNEKSKSLWKKIPLPLKRVMELCLLAALSAFFRVLLSGGM